VEFEDVRDDGDDGEIYDSLRGAFDVTMMRIINLYRVAMLFPSTLLMLDAMLKNVAEIGKIHLETMQALEDELGGDAPTDAIRKLMDEM